MINTSKAIKNLAIVASVFFCASAFAGECPEQHQVKENEKFEWPDAPLESHMVFTEELSSLDLLNEAPKLKGRRLRIRTINVKPGGHVLLHGHDKRPALAMITQGEVTEFSNLCRESVLHKTNDIIREHNGVIHWVENRTDAMAVLTVSDIVDDRGDASGNFNSSN